MSLDFTDETWTTKDGRTLQVREMTESHAKNVLRLMLRYMREQRDFERMDALEEDYWAWNEDDWGDR